MKQRKLEVAAITELFKVHPETTLDEAYALLQDHRIRHLPVVDTTDNIIGIISERDFNRAKISGVGPTVESRRQIRFPSSARVGHYMTDKIHSIQVGDELKKSIDVMLENKVSSCVVMKGDQLVGIVTTDDLLKLLKTYLESPHQSLREQFEVMLKTSPLGVFGYTLSNFGI